MALLVGELYARVTSDSSAYRRDMDQVDAKGSASAKLAEKHAIQITQARKAELDATGKVRVAMAALEELQTKGNVSASKMAAAQERLAAAQRTLAVAEDKTAASTRAATDAMEKAATGAAELADAEAKAGKEIERTDRRAGRAIGSLIGLGAAGGLAGAGIVGGLALVPLLLAGIAAAALKADENVSEAFGNLASEGKSTVQEIAEPLRDELVKAAGQAAKGLRMIAPELKQMVDDSGPAVTMLVDGFVKLAVNALPGARKAAAESEHTMAGLNAMLEHTGAGLSDFFSEMSTEAPAAGREMGDLGRLLEDLLGTTGSLLAMLSGEFQGTWARTVGVLDQTTDVALDLGETALPSVASSASTVLGVVSKLLGVLGPLAPVLGTIGGVLLSYKAGAAIVGTASDALGRLGGRMETASVGGSKLTGATRGLGSALGSIGPWGAIAGGSLLALLAVTDQLYGSTDKLATGLMAGGNAAESASKQLRQNAADAALMQTSSNGLVALYGRLFVPTMKDAEKAVSEQRASMTSLQRAQVDAAAAVADHSSAVEKYGTNSAQARAASALLVQKHEDLERVQYEAAAATKTLTDRLLEQQAAALGLANDNLRLRMATTNYEQAQHNLNETLKTGTATALEIKSAKEGVESAALSVIEAAGKETLAHYANKDSAEATTAALNAQNAKALELAAGMSGPLPAALAITIANMDDAALAALGVTRQVDGTKQTIKTLDGKTIVIDAKDGATPVINDVQGKINNMKGTTLDIHIRQLLSTTPAPGQGPADLGNPAAVLPPPKRHAGGPVLSGHYYEVNEQGREFFVPGTDGAMLNADKTSKLLDILAAGGDGASAAAPTGRTIVIENLNLNGVPTLPTTEQLRNALHDLDVKYGD